MIDPASAGQRIDDRYMDGKKGIRKRWKEEAMEWTFRQGTPIYAQIIEQMHMSIANGTFKPGQRLASVRDIATEAEVNPNTMQRALSSLEQEGLLHTERTSGRFITEEESKLDDLRKSLGNRFIDELFSNLEKLGMKKEEIIEAVEKYAADNRKGAEVK